ncbi:hypothetical protein ES708_18709 [subsurface metagenome]
MKKLSLVLVVVLIGIFLLSTPKIVAIGTYTDITLAQMIDHFNTQFARLSSTEIDRVASLLPQKDFTDGSLFMNQFAAFCRVLNTINSVIAER